MEPVLLQRAVEQLVARRDALRTQLHRDANGLPMALLARIASITLPMGTAL
jgi:arthrofactin-type cyclic lipopeptide synthetase A